MKSNTPELMKFKRLQRRLRASVREVVGLLELMWLRAGQNCPRGDIGKFTNEEIAIMVDYEDDPDELVAALIECGWVDVHPTCRVCIHDWKEHAPRWVKGNVGRHTGGFFEAKEPPKEAPRELPKEPPRDGPKGTSPRDAPPSQVKSSLTKSSQVNIKSVPSNGPVRQEYPNAFEAFWLSFPKTRRTKKKEAFRKWKLITKSVDCELLTTRAAQYAASPKGRSEYAVMPSVWLNSGMWEDEPEAWEVTNTNRNERAHDSRNDRTSAGRGSLFAS